MQENARLHAQVETLRNLGIKLELMIDPLDAENARLKAEAEKYKFTLEEERQIAREDWAGLRDDYARLKAEVERLSQPAIIGGYNISEYIRMANSETLEFDNGDIFAGMTLPERIKYIVESHARLKAEVERLTKAGDNLEQVLTEISYSYRAGNASHEWRAAKGGKQS